MYIVESAFMESFIRDTEEAKNAIRKLLTDNNISFVFIGAAARNEYASTRTTEDIDLLIRKEDKEKLKRLPIGLIRNVSNYRVFSLHNPKTKVEVIFSGEKAGSNKGVEYEDPSKLDNGNNTLTLESLVMYKLSSGKYGNRYKDFGDIQDLIIQNKLPIDYADSFREDLKEVYRQIWSETK